MSSEVKCVDHKCGEKHFAGLLITHCFRSSDKEQLVEEEDDELKEVLDLRKIAVQLLQQEQQNRCGPSPHSVLVFSFHQFIQRGS